jgi:anti-sigma B factor antagonist
MAVRVSPRSVGPGTSNGPRGSTSRVMPGASQRFVAATEHLDDGTPVVSVMGEVDLATARALEQTLLGVTEDRTGELIVDLTGCSFLDSRGLGALVATRARLERSNRRLALVLSNPSVLRIFQITGFDELFDLHPSLGAAVDHRNHDGHAGESEQLIEERERFAVVETVSGEAAQLARRSYPRQWRGREPRLETRK